MQGLKAAETIFRYQKKFGFFAASDIIKLFDTIIKPILCYGSEILGFRHCEKVEKVQSKFCKQFCCLGTNTADCLALGECGRLPLATTYMLRCLKYWVKLLRVEASRYPKQSYIMLKRLDEIGKSTWATNIKNLLFSLGFGYALVSQDVGNIEYFSFLISETLKDCCLQNWFANANELSMAHHYKQFKTLLDVERYLSLGLSFKYRKALAKFRRS